MPLLFALIPFNAISSLAGLPRSKDRLASNGSVKKTSAEPHFNKSQADVETHSARTVGSPTLILISPGQR